ncbi:MAG: hypothetical protein U0517_01740 [Candidatus Andersenbacteria bacterium]
MIAAPTQPRRKGVVDRLLGWFSLKPRHAYGIVLVVLAVGLVFAGYKLPSDPDLFWHIRAGGDILRMGIPHVDWYSHTLPTFFWIDHEYAQDVFMYWVHGLVGFKGLSIVYAILVALILSVGLRWSLARRLPWTWSLAGGLLVALGSRSFIGARPQMLTWLLVLLLLGLIRRALSSTTVGWFSLIPLLFALWANLHASFVAGFIILLVCIICESIKAIFAPVYTFGRTPRIQSVAWLAVASALSVPATFANAYGWNIWLEPYRTLTDKALHNNIVEWFAPDPYSHTGYILFGMIVVYIGFLVVRQKRADLTDVGLTLAFFVSSLLAVRNVPLFLLIAVPLALEGFRTLVVATPRTKRAWTQVVLLWPTLLALALFTAAEVGRFPWQDFGRLDRDLTVFTRDGYPEGAAAFLSQQTEWAARSQQGTVHPYNEYAWGGYLLYRVPWFKTFIDGRMPSWVGGDKGDLKIIDKYFTIDRRENWRATADEFAVNLFVIKADNALGGELKQDGRFVEVFRDAQAVVFATKELAAIKR